MQARRDERTKAGEERRRQDASVLGGSIGRAQPKPDRRAVVGSVIFHGALLIALWGFTTIRPDEPEFEVYRVKLFSPPPQVEAAAPEPVARPTPIRPPQPVERITPTPPPPTPQPAPKPQTVEQPPPEQPKPKEPEPVAGPGAQADSPGGENIDVDLEGQDFPYPDYLANIILQLQRYLRWSGSPNLENQVMFYVDRSGGVGGIRVLQRSGDINFDLQSVNAIEQAGRRGAFGPLPDGWVQDRLWVRFRFLPPG